MRKKRKLDILQFSIPLLIALGSFALSLVNYYSQVNRKWEVERPLASIYVESELVAIENTKRLAFFKVTFQNVGSLSFVIRGLHFSFKTVKTLKPHWEQNSLLDKDALLPLGMNTFEMQPPPGPCKADYRLAGESSMWHIVDPGRSVEFYFNMPIEGYGVLDFLGNIYLQVVKMAESGEELNAEEVVKGKSYEIIAEYGKDGEGEGGYISREPLFPFSFQGYLAVSR